MTDISTSAQAARSLRAVLELCGSGTIQATPEQRAYLRGAIDALAAVGSLNPAQKVHGRTRSVEKLSHFGASLPQIATSIQTLDRPLIVADCDIDTHCAAGQFTVHAIASATHLSQELRTARTRAALAVKRANGIRVGRPSSTPAEVIARIVADRERGLSLDRIANSLNTDRIPTPRGGAQWRGSSIKAILVSHEAAQRAALERQTDSAD